MPYRAYQTDKRLSKDVKGMLHRTSPLSNGASKKTDQNTEHPWHILFSHSEDH